MKFCFYGSGIYEALIGKPQGGAELQVALIAKVISEKGYPVTIIENKGCGKEIKVGDISVLFTAKTHLRGFRYFFEKIPHSICYLLRTKADFYYIRGFSLLFMLVLFATRKLNTKLILGIASDMDVLSFKKRFMYVYKNKTSNITWLKNDFFSCLVSELLLLKANIILVQHSYQQKALKSRNINSFIYPNIILPKKRIVTHGLHDYLIYVGSLNERKGLTDLLCFISKSNRIKIKIFGSAQGNRALNDLNLFSNYKNIVYSGQKPREVIIHEIANSRGLLNFSKMEGFPNTFLEAWQFGIPVFSLWVDPGGVIQRHNLGKCFNGNLTLMLTFLNNYEGEIQKKHIMKYVDQYHSYNNAADRFKSIIDNLELNNHSENHIENVDD
jgi:glycosyltransferase involved in cell wall biosynthesis